MNVEMNVIYSRKLILIQSVSVFRGSTATVSNLQSFDSDRYAERLFLSDNEIMYDNVYKQLSEFTRASHV